MQEGTMADLPQRKMSRYRSQRVSKTMTTAEDAPPLPIKSSVEAIEHNSDPIARSRSRYHVKTTTSPRGPLKDDGFGSAVSVEELSRSRPFVSESQSASPQSPRSARSQKSPVEQAGMVQSSTRHPQQEPRRYTAQRVDSGTTLQSSESYQSMDSNADSLHFSARPPRSPPHESALFPPLRPPTPQRVDGPPRSDQIRATKSAAPLTSHSNEERSGLFKMFKRKHSTDNQNTTPAESSTKAPAVGVDAPISAVNAGERRVLVECGRSKLMFPVTPNTTPIDLIKSASNTMSEQFNVRSAVMLEYFTTVGVNRPLRRYEHIRDVMNSWDNDTQNALQIIDLGLGKAEDELNLVGVPKHKPRDDQKWSLYYSHTVGKWDKRGITLKPDGQIVMVKDPKKPKEQINVCRLTDFDIYTPTPEKSKKKIKPPKKFCFAIKSQQKSSMFESTTNFVHFFCTADQAHAASFFTAVQSWRSWYLVNVMGEGISTAQAQPKTTPKKTTTAVKDRSREHRRGNSLESHYQLGTFSSLVDVDQFKYESPSTTQDTASRNKALQDGARPLHRGTSKKQPQQSSAVVVKAQLADDEPLAHLGRRISLRTGGRHTQQQLSTATFDAGVATPSRHQQLAGESLSRRDSTRRTHQKPLVDLTLAAREPVHHANKGHGHQPVQLGAGGLVEAATSWSENTVDQRNQATGREGSNIRARTSLDINSSQHASSYRPGNEANKAFTGEGLLAASQEGWGGANRGKGVMDGSRASGPMVDLSTRSHFAQGSLLRQVERHQGAQQPTIDRQKWIEKTAKTGEGY